jgi:uncharacterized 2Fe-2S/4Fe-4S cluster protein (DUF4445 family)
MSKFNDSFLVNLPVDKASLACRNAISRVGWKILTESDRFFKIKNFVGATTWPVTIEIRIYSNGAQTEIELYGKCISMGPVQLNNVKNNVSNIKNSIMAFAGNMQQQTSAAESSITDEIQKMAELYRQGIISDEEFNSFKKKLLDRS